MAPAVDFSRQASPIGGNGAADDQLRIPLWVRVRIQSLGRHFTGKIVVNVYEGGIPNFQVQPRGGDAVTFHVKR